MKRPIISILVLLTLTLTAYSQDRKPKATYRVGKATVTVWENEKHGQYGDYVEQNFKVEKLYRKDEKWESTDYFDLTELLQLRAAIDKAINEEAVKTKEEKEE